MVCGGGEGDKYLDRVLQQRTELVDDMIICGNNTDAKTEKIIKKYGYWFYRDDREWGKYQPQIKGDLLEKVAKLRPEWILPSDADEIYDKNFTRQEADRLADIGSIGYYFYIINLWNDEQHMRKYLNFWNVRFYKFAPDLGLSFLNRPLHCGLAPSVVYTYANEAPFILKHYGLMKAEDRQRKVERYKKYDPRAIHKGRDYYDALEHDTVGSPFDEDEIHQRVVDEVGDKYLKVKRIR